jgi:selenocysteine-specific elongation factor
VVAADEGWMPQTAEHVAALDALGVRHAVLAVTRSDLADPAPVMRSVRARLEGTTLEGLPAVAVSAPTGTGLPELRAALEEMVAGLAAPDTAAPVRLWVDRAFTIRGAGTVVTGTLSAGTLHNGDRLTLHSATDGARAVRVRGLQSLGRPADRVQAVARVAVNLRGIDRGDVKRGDALLTPDRWASTSLLDVRVDGDLSSSAASLVLHIGSAAVPVHVRPLGGASARLALDRTVPAAPGDVALLRDPGRHRVVGRVTVLDIDPRPLVRRGAAAARARELAEAQDGLPDGAVILRRRGIVRVAELRATGASMPSDAVEAGEWLVDQDLAGALRKRMVAAVAEHHRSFPIEAGPTVEAVRGQLDVPDRTVVVALVAPPLAVRDGRVVDVTAPPPLPAHVATAVKTLTRELQANPFVAPDAGRLAALGLGTRELAAAERAGALLRVTDGVVLLPGADERAAAVLASLTQPFTLSDARQALGTTRRVAVPLLELLDRRRLTRRLPDDRRTVAEP